MTNKQQQQRIIKMVTKLLEENRFDEANEILYKEARKTSELDNVANLLNAQRYDDAAKVLTQTTNFRGGRWIVGIVLGDSNVPKDLQSAVLQKFLDAQNNYSRDFTQWEHDLRALTPFMWKLRLIEWLERFYKAVFRKSVQPHQSMYRFDLIHQFADYATWSDDPARFGLTADTVPVDVPFRDRSFVISSLKEFPFSSEVDHLRWRLETRQDSAQIWDDLHAKVIELREKDIDPRVLIGIEKKAIKKRAQQLIREIRKPLDSHVRESVAEDTDALIKFLTKLAFNEKRS